MRNTPLFSILFLGLKRLFIFTPLIIYMRQILEEKVIEAIEFINSARDDVLDQYSERYADTQESLVGYVFQIATENDDDELLSYFVYYYTLIMYIFEKAFGSLVTVPDEAIDSFHAEYSELLEEYSENEDFSELNDFIGQPVLVDFLIHDISSDDENGNVLPDETQNILNTVLIGLVGILSKSVNKQHLN